MKVLSESEVTVLAHEINQLTNEEFSNLLRIFPYKSLRDIHLFDEDLFRKYVCILKRMVKSEYFYTFLDAIQCTINFCIENLTHVNNTTSEQLLLDLYTLLEDVISRVNNVNILMERVIFDQDLILSRIAATTKLEIFGAQHVDTCRHLFLYSMPLSGNLLSEMGSQWATEIFIALVKFCSPISLLDVYEFILKRCLASSEIFRACSNWISENLSRLVFKPQKKEGQENLVRMLKILITCYKRLSSAGKLMDKDAAVFSKRLMGISEKIIKIICLSPAIRNSALNLFEIIFYNFLSEEGLNAGNVRYELRKLPENFKKWPNANNDAFLHICHLLCKQKRCLWKPNKVLQCIANILRTQKSWKFFDESLLKSMVFLYPIMSLKILNKETILLGDEILKIVANRYNISLDSLFSNTSEEFLWVMNRGPHTLQKYALMQYISKGNDIKIVKDSIIELGDVALSILMDPQVDEESVNKLIKIISKNCQDLDISTKVSLKLSELQCHTKLFQRLILLNPAVLDSKSASLEMYIMIFSNLEKIQSKQALKATCSYIIKLLCFLKQDMTDQQFCDMRNLSYLLDVMNNLDDDIAEEILLLLKILLTIQKKNHIMIFEILQINVSSCLKGSETKIKNSLDLLKIILTSDVLIKLEYNSIPLVSQSLCCLISNPNVSIDSFICLTILLKKNKWLAFSIEICYFVEEQCSILEESGCCPEFTSFLICWVKSLNKCMGQPFLYFPNKSTIFRYMVNSRTFSQNKIRACMAILENLAVL